MSKKKNRRQRRRHFPPEASAPQNVSSNAAPGQRPPRRWGLIVLFIAIAIGGVYLQRLLRPRPPIEEFTYDLVATHPHDPTSFTQGLVLAGGHVWESTGKYGESKVRKYELETGKVVAETALDKEYFGEGLALAGGKLYQLTWKEETCFVYDLDLNKIDEVHYDGQGWGLTFDGVDLIMSDGTSQIRFVDPQTFETKRVIDVRRGFDRITALNELEYSGGRIYANQWNTDFIYKIDPRDGQVLGRIDLSGLWPARQRPDEGLMNGIAVDAREKRIIVTGKYCPKIFEVTFKPVASDK